MSASSGSPRGGSGFLPGLILGGALGAALGLLFAPRSGREQRELLAERGIELTGRMDEVLPGAAEAIQERATALLEAQRERFRRATEAAREERERARQKLTEQYEAAKRGETSG